MSEAAETPGGESRQSTPEPGRSLPAWVAPVGVILLSAAVLAGVVLYGLAQQKKERVSAAGPEYVEVSEEKAREVLAALQGRPQGLGAHAAPQGDPRSSAPPRQTPAFGAPPMQVPPQQAEAGAILLVNSSDFEAVARIVPEGARAAGQYFRIPPFATVPIKGVPPGRYAVFYSTGRNWDDSVKRFKVDPAYSRSFASLPDKKGGKEASVILYHPEDPERKRSSEADFSG